MDFHKKSKKKKRSHRAASGTGDASDCCCIVGECFDGIGDCFVATAANDDNLVAPQVTTLRAYRDQRLRTNPAGRAFTDLYYAYGRYGARYLRRYPFLKPVVRAMLEPLVRYAARRIR